MPLGHCGSSRSDTDPIDGSRAGIELSQESRAPAIPASTSSCSRPARTAPRRHGCGKDRPSKRARRGVSGTRGPSRDVGRVARVVRTAPCCHTRREPKRRAMTALMLGRASRAEVTRRRAHCPHRLKLTPYQPEPARRQGINFWPALTHVNDRRDGAVIVFGSDDCEANVTEVGHRVANDRVLRPSDREWVPKSLREAVRRYDRFGPWALPRADRRLGTRFALDLQPGLDL